MKALSTSLENKKNLAGARLAYDNRDANASAQVHKKKEIEMGLKDSSPENHQKSGEFIKSVVLGGLDGIVTTFAVVSGATGGGLGIEVILVLGFSNILADALSMGVGDALSSKAEQEYILAEKDREIWEMENYPEGEIQEMIDIFTKKGMTKVDSELIIRKYAEYPELFVEFMMNFELDLPIPNEDDNPWKHGLVTFCSFVFFGLFPLLGYAVLYNTSISESDLFIISCNVSAIMFFILGAVKTKFSKKKWYYGGIEILVMGSSTAAVSYLVGFLVEIIIR
jgi:DNA damage-binding protein 1